MSDKSAEWRQKLFDAQEMSPALRASYHDELDRMLNPKLTLRTAAPGVLLLVVLVVCTVALVRNLFVADPGPLTFVGWTVLVIAFAYTSYLIVRDLWLRTHSPKSRYSIANALVFAAGASTVVALLAGMQNPADPASTFKAFYVFVFYTACVAWSIEGRIAAAELAAREQMLRIECLLADVAERLQK